jgi:glycosyltransferase involved in cell wall biosynthesis
VTSDRYSNRPDYETRWRDLLGERILKPGVYQEEGLSVHRLATRFEVGPRPWLINLDRYVSNLKPDYLIVHGVVTFTPLRLARHFRRSRTAFPVVFDSHANAINSNHRHRARFYQFYKYFLRQWVEKSANALVAIDSDSRDFLVEECGFSAGEVSIIPLGADCSSFRRDEEVRFTIRTQLEIAESDCLAIYAGKVEERKGIHLLVDASIRLMKQRSNFHLMIVGNGPEDYIRSLKSKIPDSLNRFHWHPMVGNAELFRLYSAADISCWPREVSIGTLEAQACSLPLIVADAPILRDRVAWNNGLTFESDSVDSLYACLEQLCDSPNQRMDLGRNGRAAAESQFDWKILAERFLQFGRLDSDS